MASSGQEAVAPVTTSRKPYVEEEVPSGDTNMTDAPEAPVSGTPGFSQESYDTSQRIVKSSIDDYYGILGLKKDCTDDQIKKRYKKLALLTHPDQNKWPDSKQAFQMVGLAYAVLKDASKRSSYDKRNPKTYTPPIVEAEMQFGEEFGPNAFGGDDSGDELSDVSEDEISTTAKPNEAVKAIYKTATPLIKDILEDPPSAREKPRIMEQVDEFNKQIKAQNKIDGLDDKNLGQFLIPYTIFESNALLAKPHWEKYKKDPHDQSALEMMGKIERTLKNAITKNDYDSEWCYEALGFKPNGGNSSGRGQQNTGHGRDSSTAGKPASSEGSTVVTWKPGHTLTGEKIIAMLPRERNVRSMGEDGVPGPLKKVVTGYQFIVKDEKENLIELVSGEQIGRRATSGYLSLPKDQIIDARYSDERVTQEDAEFFESLIDFTAKAFKTRSSETPRHPAGYGLALFKNGTEEVLSRTALRKMLGQTDADFEIQECEKRNGKIPAWKIPALGWREPRKMIIEKPSRTRRRREMLMRGDQSDDQGLFVPKDRTFKIPTGRRGRSSSRSPAHSAKNGGRSVSRTSVTAEEVAGIRREMQDEVAGMRKDMQDLKDMFRQLMLK
ncbi:hypothetical protein BKA64DRAFT_710051 [Cadophora sp. MPI-SDFR-AT-0126]|nr:hypothetical protein BKA64DRAFT_710051 [Leotiomycetes sp. MPI-SDFR-AT-0126]